MKSSNKTERSVFDLKSKPKQRGPKDALRFQRAERRANTLGIPLDQLDELEDTLQPMEA